MGYKLYGFLNTPSTRRVLVIANELGIELEYIHVDLSKGESRDPEFVDKKQPFGQIPVLEDGELIIHESRAICRYLAVKHASPLLPDPSKDLKAYSQVEQALSVEYGYYDRYAHEVCEEMLFGPHFKGIPTNQPVLEHVMGHLKKNLAVYETILGKHKYLAGDELSLADLFHLPLISLHRDALKLDLYDAPNLSRWSEEISERQSWKDVQSLT